MTELIDPIIVYHASFADDEGLGRRRECSWRKLCLAFGVAKLG
jgi:hypothetical protein